MISKLRIIERNLNLLLLFLLPTQLAIHYWPQFSFIFGIRIDYLAPSIYFTDILFLSLFIFWAINFWKRIFSDIRKNFNYIVVLLLFVGVNSIFSSFTAISLIKWLKVVELLVFAYYLKQRNDVFTKKDVSKTLFYSLLTFSVIGILQFINGKTLGGVLYYLGERSFSIFTPGIALFNVFGKNFLRAYSTFPHPNSLAGYFGLSLIYLYFNKVNVNKFIKIVGFILIIVALILTVSTSVFLGLVVCVFIYLTFQRFLVGKETYTTMFIILFALSLFLSLFSKLFINSSIKIPLSYKERIELADVSGKIISDNWITGVGLNTFIPNENNITSSLDGNRLFQPVHNIYLLIFSETGIIGIVLLYLLFYKINSINIKLNNKIGTLLVYFILITGLFDHYWFTIQQNLFILVLLLTVSSEENG